MEKANEQVEGVPHHSQLLMLCKALLDEERILLLGVLAQHAASVNNLHSVTALPAAAIQRHLQLLEQAGLVTRGEVSADDEPLLYQLDVPSLQAMKRTLFADRTAAPTGTDEEKVLGRFVRNGRLESLPTHLGKLRTVLAWLAEQFEPGTRYPESEVKRVLMQFHADHATLRRLLVDHGYLQRERGIYWKETDSIS